MSNESQQVERHCEVRSTEGGVEAVLLPKERQIGDFAVRRVLPNRRYRKIGPWVFFDHLGPVTFPAGRGINVPPHPHINLATVTYLFAGEMLHRDSLGTVQPIRPGDINLMLAGRGIVHSERERPEVTAVSHDLHCLQLWLALPEDLEESDPAFYHYPSADIPHAAPGDVAVRVMMGSAFGVTSPVKTFADTLYVEARLEAGERLLVPEAQERAVYVASGSVQAGDTRIPEATMGVLAPAARVELQATEDSRIAIIGGESLSPRFMEWNFVSSRRERIEAAKADWRAERFPPVPGDEGERLELPTDKCNC
jgi:hypothetical protein